MALASESEVEAALGRDLTEGEDVTSLLERASDRVVGYLRHTPDPVPDPVARIVGEMVAAVLTKPAVNNSDYGANGYNVIRESMTVKIGNESATTTGPWITRSQKLVLDMYRNFKTRGVFSISLVDPDVEAGS